MSKMAEILFEYAFDFNYRELLDAEVPLFKEYFSHHLYNDDDDIETPLQDAIAAMMDPEGAALLQVAYMELINKWDLEEEED